MLSWYGPKKIIYSTSVFLIFMYIDLTELGQFGPKTLNQKKITNMLLYILGSKRSGLTKMLLGKEFLFNYIICSITTIKGPI